MSVNTTCSDLFAVQIYGAVTLNNTLCLGVFLLIVHYKRLTWTYTSEVAILVGVSCPPCASPHLQGSVARMCHPANSHVDSTVFALPLHRIPAPSA